MLKTKSVIIGNFEINIIQLNAFEALAMRNKLVSSFEKQIDIAGEQSSMQVFKAIAGLIYKIPPELLLELFKSCSAIGDDKFSGGQLSNKDIFNAVFSDNIDGTIELAMEVLDLNGFFTLNTLSILAKKFPMLAPIESSIKEMMKVAIEKK